MMDSQKAEGFYVIECCQRTDKILNVQAYQCLSLVHLKNSILCAQGFFNIRRHTPVSLPLPRVYESLLFCTICQTRQVSYLIFFFVFLSLMHNVVYRSSTCNIYEDWVPGRDWQVRPSLSLFGIYVTCCCFPLNAMETTVYRFSFQLNTGPPAVCCVGCCQLNVNLCNCRV